MIITAIILDGFHKGHVVHIEYMPTIKLLKPRSLRVDYCCDGEIHVDTPIPEDVEYKVCFRSIDMKVVMYSEKGESETFLSWFKHEVTSKVWTEWTTLYFGYHNEPVRRKDDGTQMTEYERGFEKGVMEGRILQAKENKY